MIFHKETLLFGVILAGVIGAAGGVAALPVGDLVMANPLGQRLQKSLKGGRQFEEWTARSKRSGKNPYAFAVTAAIPSAGGNAEQALLAVSCILGQPSVSVIYDGKGMQFSEPMPVSIKFDEDLAEENVVVPLTGADAIGVFDFRAFLLIQAMQDKKVIEISLPEANEQWRFEISGLRSAITYMQDRCNLGFQVRVAQSEMTQIQTKLRRRGYDAPTNGYVDSQMKEVLKEIQSKHGLNESGLLDQKTYDLLLKEIGE
ncbi:MAG TPA: peptidoglycan-binding domain-containing protein [Paenirhodobacter sp.]